MGRGIQARKELEIKHIYWAKYCSTEEEGTYVPTYTKNINVYNILNVTKF